MAHALACSRLGPVYSPRSRDLLRPSHGRAGADRPKEVRRNSTINRKREVAELLAARGRPFATAAELRANESGSNSVPALCDCQRV